MREKLWTICFITYAILLIWLCATRMDLIRDALAFLTLAIVVAPIVLILIAFIMNMINNFYK